MKIRERCHFIPPIGGGRPRGLTGSVDRPIHAPPAVHRIAAGHYCCVLLILGLAGGGGGPRIGRGEPRQGVPVAERWRWRRAHIGGQRGKRERTLWWGGRCRMRPWEEREVASGPRWRNFSENYVRSAGKSCLIFFLFFFNIFYLNNEAIGTPANKLKPNAFSLKETNIEIHEETFVFYRK